jgi:putative DNA primase/helicase
MNQIEAAPQAGTTPGESASRAREQAQQPELPGLETLQPADSAQEDAASQAPSGTGHAQQAAPAATSFLGRLNTIARQIGLFDGFNGAPPALVIGQNTVPPPSAGTEPPPNPDPLPGFDIPQSLRNRYLIDTDGKYYFRDRDHALAFEDLGPKLRTLHEDADTATSMVELAEAKGWSKLKLRGTDPFKRAAWLAAAERGIATTGYRPTALDKTRLAERPAARAREAAQRANAIAPQAAQPGEPAASEKTKAKTKTRETATAKTKTKTKQHAAVTEPSATEPPQRKENKALPAPEQHTTHPRHQRAVEELKKFLRQRGDSEAAVAMTATLAADELARHRTHYGRVLEHGPARYQHNADNDLSYFVTLQTPGGRQTIWGADLQRAMAGSGANVGDGIVLSQRGSRSVTVNGPKVDSQGKPTGKRVAIDANRHDWEVISLDNARDFLKAEPGARKDNSKVHVRRTIQAHHTDQEHGQTPALNKQR